MIKNQKCPQERRMGFKNAENPTNVVYGCPQCLATCGQHMTKMTTENTSKSTTLKPRYIIKTKSACTKPRVNIFLLFIFLLNTHYCYKKSYHTSDRGIRFLYPVPVWTLSRTRLGYNVIINLLKHIPLIVVNDR